MVVNPNVNTPLFAATVVAAALQLYQVDPVHKPWGLRMTTCVEQIISMTDLFN